MTPDHRLHRCRHNNDTSGRRRQSVPIVCSIKFHSAGDGDDGAQSAARPVTTRPLDRNIKKRLNFPKQTVVAGRHLMKKAAIMRRLFPVPLAADLIPRSSGGWAGLAHIHPHSAIDLDLLTDSCVRSPPCSHFSLVHSGSVCAAALNLPDTGLKSNLMQRSPESQSSNVVNNLK